MRTKFAALLFAAGLSAAAPAHASLFSGDTLDLVANILAWIVLFVAPIIAIGVFWLVHILPEKIAENRHHPQAQAIKTLCLLSLFFGGLLWPLAWLWAYSKPVLYKLAYGVDTVKHGADEEPAIPAAAPEPAASTERRLREA
jgi:CBS domain containing-hemolysin-like protein